MLQIDSPKNDFSHLEEEALKITILSKEGLVNVYNI